MKRMALAALLLGLASPAFAGGGGTPTHTSYNTGPTVIVKTEPAVTVVVGGGIVPQCGCCGFATQVGLNQTRMVVSTGGQTKNFWVWGGS